MVSGWPGDKSPMRHSSLAFSKSSRAPGPISLSGEVVRAYEKQDFTGKLHLI